MTVLSVCKTNVTERSNFYGSQVVVALDDTQRSRDAFSWAVAHAYRPGDELVFFAVSRDQDDPSSMSLLRVHSEYCVAHNIPHEGLLCVSSESTGVVTAIMEQFQPKLFVMGSSNKETAKDRLLGSTTDCVLHMVDVPVAIVKTDFVLPLLDATPAVADRTRKLAIAVDASNHARGAFNWVAHNFRQPNDTIYVINVAASKKQLPPGQMVPQEVPPLPGLAGLLSGERLMEVYACAIRDEGLQQADDCEVHLLFSRAHKKSPPAVFAALVESLGIDVVVVGCRGGRGTIEQTLLGSFSRELVHTCPRNVVVVKTTSTP